MVVVCGFVFIGGSCSSLVDCCWLILLFVVFCVSFGVVCVSLSLFIVG